MSTLKEIRESKGLTQADLARTSSVSLSWIRVIEQGGAGTVSDDVQAKIVGVLGHVPKEFQPKRAYWKSELYSDSNPIIKDPVRLFVQALTEKATQAGDREVLYFIEEAKKNESFIWLQQLIGIAQAFQIKLPRL